MKTFLFIISTLFFYTAQGQDSSFVNGNQAYANGDFEAALTAYQKILASEKKSSELYYNLGNTYYKLDELGEAIWAYENALKINPANENALFNLKFANKQTYDGIEIEEGGVLNWLEINLFSHSINLWAYLSLIFSFLLAVSLYFFFTTKTQKIKNAALTIGFGAVFFLIATIAFASLNKSNIIDQTEGVIVIEAVEMRSSPSETAPSNFSLHEGTKVELLRSNNDWIEIGLNGNTGWVTKETIWEI